MDYKAVLGMNRSVGFGEVPDSKNDVYEFLKTILLLVQAMRLSDETWEKHFERLFEQITAVRIVPSGNDEYGAIVVSAL